MRSSASLPAQPIVVIFNRTIRTERKIISRDVNPNSVFAFRNVVNGRPRVAQIEVGGYLESGENGSRILDLSHMPVVLLDRDKASNARQLVTMFNSRPPGAFVVLFEGSFSLFVVGNDTTPVAEAVARARAEAEQAAQAVVRAKEQRRQEKRDARTQKRHAIRAQRALDAENAMKLANMPIGKPKAFVTSHLTSVECDPEKLVSVQYRPDSNSGWNEVRTAHAYRDVHVADECFFWKVCYVDTAAEAVELDAITMSLVNGVAQVAA
jgi:hypothetical protein